MSAYIILRCLNIHVLKTYLAKKVRDVPIIFQVKRNWYNLNISKFIFFGFSILMYSKAFDNIKRDTFKQEIIGHVGIVP